MRKEKKSRMCLSLVATSRTTSGYLCVEIYEIESVGMFDMDVYFASRIFLRYFTLNERITIERKRERTRKCVKDYHQSPSFVAESLMFFFFFFFAIARRCRRSQWCNRTTTTTLVSTSLENRLLKAQHSYVNVWINKRPEKKKKRRRKKRTMYTSTLDWTENRLIQMYWLPVTGWSSLIWVSFSSRCVCVGQVNISSIDIWLVYFSHRFWLIRCYRWRHQHDQTEISRQRPAW